jgi:HEAT repeat protein
MRTRRAKRVLLLLAALLSASAGCSSAKRVEYSVPSRVKTLKEDKDPNMRYWAAESLGNFGPEAQRAVPDLVAALQDESTMVRVGAANALGQLGAADAVPALQGAGKDADKSVRTAAASALKQIRQKGKRR